MSARYRPAAMILAGVAGAAPRVVAAHGDGLTTPETLWRAWNLDPLLLAGLAAVAWVYLRGIHELWRRAGSRRGVRPWRAGAFIAGWTMVAVALVSPLDPLGRTIFAAHMAQHLLLILVAPPLLLAGKPVVGLLWGLPRSWRIAAGGARNSRAGRAGELIATLPVLVVALHSGALWFWHAPALYRWAIRSELAHVLEHAAFFGTALLFWALILRAGAGRAPGHGFGILAVFAMALQGSALGTLLTFATIVWFPVHEAGAAAWGMTALQDQQLAGLIMWIPAGLAYTVTALALMAAWIDGLEPRFPALRSSRASSGEGVIAP